jgi:pimeloyl-ACP methyl ester carboxylesterase
VTVVALPHGPELMADIDNVIGTASPPVWFAGVSYGAHVAAAVAAKDRRVQGLLAIAPAWTGDPSPLAQVGRDTARSIRERGVQSTLAEIRAHQGPAWVHEELTNAWSRVAPKDLADHLEFVAGVPAPTAHVLSTVRCPTVVVGFTDDPGHPWAVAEHWHRSIPRSRLLALPLASVGVSRPNLGGPALSNLRDLWSTFERIMHLNGDFHGLHDLREAHGDGIPGCHGHVATHDLD